MCFADRAQHLLQFIQQDRWSLPHASVQPISIPGWAPARLPTAANSTTGFTGNPTFNNHGRGPAALSCKNVDRLLHNVHAERKCAHTHAYHRSHKPHSAEPHLTKPQSSAASMCMLPYTLGSCMRTRRYPDPTLSHATAERKQASSAPTAKTKHRHQCFTTAHTKNMRCRSCIFLTKYIAESMLWPASDAYCSIPAPWITPCTACPFSGSTTQLPTASFRKCAPTYTAQHSTTLLLELSVTC